MLFRVQSLIIHKRVLLDILLFEMKYKLGMKIKQN